MGRGDKRSRREGSSSSSSKIDSYKRHQSSSAANPNERVGKAPTFVSYLDTPNLHPKVKLLCEIIASTPSVSVEKVLEDTGVRISPEDVEEVLKLSYGFPGSAVKFFRWSGYQLSDKHSPYAWNLVVDLLGKNSLFEAMWDAIKSMKKEGLLSLATFASVFSSYSSADRVKEAIMAFDVMEQYGCPRDTVALNSLLSAICREGKTTKAYDLMSVVRGKIRVDADSYAILLEGWENEADAMNARRTFTEMVAEIGWDPKNVPAYNSFLITLLKSPNGGTVDALKSIAALKVRGCYPGLEFFRAALEECVKTGDGTNGKLLWQEIIGSSGLKVDTQMCNSMIALYCYLSETDMAIKLLDEMVYQGAFPDSETYNVLLRFLIKGRKLRDIVTVFTEMTKNECIPSEENCSSAVKVLIDNGDPYAAIKVWKYMVDNFDAQSNELEETGNMMVVGLRDMKRVQEAVKYAEDMVDRQIKVTSFTLSKLKQSLSKMGKGPVYDELLRKWKKSVG